MPGAVQRPELWLAPLRGVTIRAFREAFADPIREAGFAGAFAPFVPANPGLRVNDRMLADLAPFPAQGGADGLLPVVPQVISRHPDAMRELLKGLKDRGFDRCDLNAGCPFPMIRRRGRGSGLFQTPDVLDQLLAAGCEEMGPGRFSLKIRLGLERPDELLKLMPVVNRHPLAVLTVHARTAKQMYEGGCDLARFREIAAASANPVMYNGDVPFPVDLKGRPAQDGDGGRAPDRDGGGLRLEEGGPSDRPDYGVDRLMVGRSFVRALGARDDSGELLRRYVAISQAELSGDRPVLGRMKELLTYWTEVSPRWRRLWPVAKTCRTVDELLLLTR